MNEKGEPLKNSLRGMVLNRKALEDLEKTPHRFASEDLLSAWREFWEPTNLCVSGSGYILGSSDQPQKKFLMIHWVPLVLRVYAKDCLFAFPLMKTSRAKRLSVRLQVNLPEREPPRILKIKTGRLEGVSRTLEGKPVANFLIIAQFAESELVDWLNRVIVTAWRLAKRNGWMRSERRGYWRVLPDGRFSDICLKVSMCSRLNRSPLL